MSLVLSTLIRRHASKLVYSEYGVPSEVVRLENFDDPKVSGPHDVVLKMLAAPIHPADINTIQGTYALKPSLPAVGGGEGIGRVIAVGSEVSKFKLGDLAFPTGNMSGTWTTHFKGDASKCVKVSSKLDRLVAATLRTNPATAYRMLKDFVNLKEGDVVIQNGANSAVGQAVIQIAKAMNVTSVNVVRDRSDIADLKKQLREIGADLIVTEQELRQMTDFRDGKLSKPKLALNCVGGQSSTELLQCLSKGGVHVTYGGMSLKPVISSTSALIFKDISLRGFWMSRWLDENSGHDSVTQMYDDLTQMAISGKLTPPIHRCVPLKDYAAALSESMTGFKTGKLIFDFEMS